MKQITIYREDFDGHADSEGMEYFNYILNSLGIPEQTWPDIATLELTILEFTAIRYNELSLDNI